VAPAGTPAEKTANRRHTKHEKRNQHEKKTHKTIGPHDQVAQAQESGTAAPESTPAPKQPKAGAKAVEPTTTEPIPTQPPGKHVKAGLPTTVVTKEKPRRGGGGSDRPRGERDPKTGVDGSDEP
jgi:hypothetical protein